MMVKDSQRKSRRGDANKLVCDRHLILFYEILIKCDPAVEKFHSFREVHTLEWHAHRHELGQTFLNQFVRQVCGFAILICAI